MDCLVDMRKKENICWAARMKAEMLRLQHGGRHSPEEECSLWEALAAQKELYHLARQWEQEQLQQLESIYGTLQRAADANRPPVFPNAPAESAESAAEAETIIQRMLQDLEI